MLLFELKRAFHGRLFKISFVLAMILVIGQAFAFRFIDQSNVTEMKEYLLEDGSYLMGVLPSRLFESFIGGESYTFWGEIYFSLLPILAALPFGASFFEDTRKGYAKYIISRKGKKPYLKAKAVAVILTGGLAGALPYVVSFLVTSLLYPAYYPNALVWDHLIGEATIFSNLYFTHPFLYVLIYAGILFMVGGLLSLTAVVFAEFVNNILLVLFIPYILYTLQDAILTKIELSKWSLKVIVDPSRYGGELHYASPWNLVVFLGALYLLLGGFWIWRTRKIDWMTQ